MEQSQQSQQSQPVEISKSTLLQELPKLPYRPAYTQCVAFIPDDNNNNNNNNTELLICGGLGTKYCYSYHIQKQQYKLICSYPDYVQLSGHTIISYRSNYFNDYNFNSNNTTNNNLILLSFGGDRSIKYHTLFMKYQSVWNQDNEKEIKTTWSISNNVFNQWTPHHQYNIQIGEGYHSLRGARALVGGSNQNLLFFTHYPNNINVMNLKNLQYINKGDTLPVSEIRYHCFVAKDEKDRNTFILMVRDETFLIRYNESNNIFYYQKLSTQPFFTNCNAYGFVYWNNSIFIFGGYNEKQNKMLDSIWELEINENYSNWKEWNIKIPFALRGAVAIVNENDSSIHIISGLGYHEALNTHYVMHMWSTERIGAIMDYWIRENKWKIGWIIEFNDIVAKYLIYRKIYQ